MNAENESSTFKPYFIPSLIAAGLSALSLSFIQIKAERPMLLAERFLEGLGWIEIVGLAIYAAFLVIKMSDPRQAPKWRLRIWRLFSIVFFGQLIIGLAGADRFLMTGELHIPVPAVILAGPLYRGEGLFMPILFISTMVLVGPAWCSHLCYIGAWDNTLALRKRRPIVFGFRRHIVRTVIIVLVVAAALATRFLNTNVTVVIFAAIAFGVLGILIMLIVSAKTGQMIHCVVFCPIGLLANLFGKISPFRLVIDQTTCDSCLKCRSACRYNALDKSFIENGKPGFNCTLCGDCMKSCDQNAIHYKFTPWLSSATARKTFLVMTIALHTIFLGVARI